MQLEAEWPARRGAKCGGGLWTRLVYHIDDNGQVANAVSKQCSHSALISGFAFRQELRNYGLFFLIHPPMFLFLQEGRKLGYSAMPGVLLSF